MKTGENIGKLPGPTPGSKKAVRQHQYMAQGYTVPDAPRRVDTFQRESETGETHAPGLTTKPVRRM
jgi:hypothetical protein